MGVRKGADPVSWTLALFAADFFLQRISLPGISIPVTVPLSLVWLALGLSLRVLMINGRRLLLWLLAAGTSALVVIPQLVIERAPYVSPTSWAYWVVIWLPIVVSFRDRSRSNYRRCLQRIADLGVALSVLSVVFVALQLLGVIYEDWMAKLVPAALLVQGYIISYPIVYGSSLYKSNAWFALEPSFLSFLLGVCLVSAVSVRAHPLKVLVVLLGLLSTAAGSGFAIAAVGLVVLAVTHGVQLFRAYLLPAATFGVLAFATPFGQAILSRASEVNESTSSTSLRAVQPYLFLWPHWLNEPASVVIGRGAGSSRWITDNGGVGGLLVPSVAKVLFDYGLVAGLLLLAVIVATYAGSQEPALAVALAASMLTVQAAAPPLVLISIIVCSLWAPPLPRSSLSPGHEVLEAFPEASTVSEAALLTPVRGDTAERPVSDGKTRIAKGHRGRKAESVNEANPATPANAEAKFGTEAGPVTAADVDAEWPVAWWFGAAHRLSGTEAGPVTAADVDAEWPVAWWFGAAHRLSGTEAGPVTAADVDAEWPVAWWFGAAHRLSGTEAGPVTAADVDAEWPVAWWFGAAHRLSGTEAGPVTAADVDAEWPVAWWFGAAHRLSGTEAGPVTAADVDAEWPVAWWLGAAHRLSGTEAGPAATSADGDAGSGTEAGPAVTAEAENPTTAAPAAGAAALADD